MSTNLISRSEKSKKKGILNALGFNYMKSFTQDPGSEEMFLQCITKAHQDVEDAENYFENVTDFELVDHAIYRMEAARSKYSYLIKQAKQRNIQV